MTAPTGAHRTVSRQCAGSKYFRVEDYYIPDLTLPEESRPIGKWGRMHREYLREHKPIQYNCLLLSGKLWTYLDDLNEQAEDRLERIIEQMKSSEGITEDLLFCLVSGGLSIAF